ncbi:MAG: 2Fe-2S iron-sulfur cluster-binding protein, partial [Pseudomonadota bacterium]|nr:2Fe-2S iron-sulfur cluster-binding protein [Pseudomonadota bacterium]
MLISIYRFNPETDTKPVMEDIEVDVAAGADLMVLDVLALAKEKDSTIAYRRSCREGVCGSDGM